MSKTEIIFIDEETLTTEELERPAEKAVPARLERYLHEVESYGQTAE